MRECVPWKSLLPRCHAHRRKESVWDVFYRMFVDVHLKDLKTYRFLRQKPLVKNKKLLWQICFRFFVCTNLNLTLIKLSQIKRKLALLTATLSDCSTNASDAKFVHNSLKSYSTGVLYKHVQKCNNKYLLSLSGLATSQSQLLLLVRHSLPSRYFPIRLLTRPMGTFPPPAYSTGVQD